MTYETSETSIQDAQPREIYSFALATIGSFNLTSSKDDETFGGVTYSAIAISRSNATSVPLGQRRELTITLPVDHPLTLALLGNGVPPRDATLKIQRFHNPSDTPMQIWDGVVASISTDDQYARLRVPATIDVAFDVRIPILKAGRTCPHALYGPGCQAPRTDAAVQVSTVAGATIGVTVYPLADGWAKHGEMVHTVTGERRSILNQTGTTFVVDVPFTTLAPGNVMNVASGCDGLIKTCRDKYNNVGNFGGHPDLPEVNPSTPVHPKPKSVWDILKGAL
ncbi:MAG: phage BR0599 family protein [Thermoleophilaceae bacterium]|nr:phage BR0599 family protein [Thermoleophilaceae bacterium]